MSSLIKKFHIFTYANHSHSDSFTQQSTKVITNLTNVEGRTVDEKIVTSAGFRGGSPLLNRRVLDHNYNLNYISSFSRYKGTHISSSHTFVDFIKNLAPNIYINLVNFQDKVAREVHVAPMRFVKKLWAVVQSARVRQATAEIH